MDQPPELPLMPDGTLPPTILLLRWMERHRSPVLLTNSLPPGNQILPDLLRLGGVTELRLSGSARPLIRWEGSGGGRVSLREPGCTTPDEDAPLHCGALPSRAGNAGWDAGPLQALLDLARLEDASAAVGAGQGASWDGLLAANHWGNASRRPPISALAGRGEDGLGAWNPLAIARHCLLSIPPNTGPAPWSVIDDLGARYPLQLAEGPMGPTWLVQVPLGPLAGTSLRLSEEPAPGSHWEVDATVLDNGRVRVELDSFGQIARICWDGVFADLSGPACAPSVDGMALSGAAEITVLEDGPLRARVAVRRDTPAGCLDLVYTLHANEDHLRVTASWSGETGCWFDHATAQRSADLHLAAEGARWVVPQSASVITSPYGPTPGVRWAMLADPAGRGIAAVSPRALTIHAWAGHLHVLAAPSATWALAAPRRQPGALSLGQLAEHLAMPGRPLPGWLEVPRPFRLADLGSLVPLWVSRPPGSDGELLLAEQAGCRARTWLFPRQPLTATSTCWKVDAIGNRLAPCPPTPDRDGWQLDAAPGEIMLVRWQLAG